MKRLHRGKKGFTLIELLIVIAVLAALAAVVVPAVSSFLKSANVAASNTEAANVRSAAMAYLSDNGCFPNKSADLVAGNYMSAAPGGTYIFGTGAADNNNTPADSPNTTGTINVNTIRSATGGGRSTGLTWDFATQQWKK